MDLARALAADLRDLAVDLSSDGFARTTLAMIEHNLRRSVRSALGASITLRTPASPGGSVTVNFVSRTIKPGEIEAAAVVPLPGLSTPRKAWITFYAAQPEAFAPLLPHLAQALHLDLAEIEQQPPLPVSPINPEIEGLHDFSVINRAFGVLLNRGYTLDGARAELARHAELTQTTLSAASQALLSSAYQ